MGKLQAFASGVKNGNLHLKPVVMFNDNGSLVTKWNEVPTKRKGKKRETNMKYIVGKTNEKMESTLK